jgi:formate-dependent nitrite reductase membrane component NrfD
MVRMFRPTSALNVGGWVIGASGGALAVAAFAPEKPAITRAVGDAAGLAGGASGLLLATYTGAVLPNTAIPVWRDMRRTLPFLFAASAASGAASALQLGDPDEPAAGVVRRLSTASKLAELAAAVAVERELGPGPSGRPLRTGRSGWLWTAGKALGAASLVASLASRRSRRAVVASGVLGTLAGVMVRFALHDAGIASGRDPRASL